MKDCFKNVVECNFLQLCGCHFSSICLVGMLNCSHYQVKDYINFFLLQNSTSVWPDLACSYTLRSFPAEGIKSSEDSPFLYGVNGESLCTLARADVLPRVEYSRQQLVDCEPLKDKIYQAD